MFYTGIGARKTPGPINDILEFSPLYKFFYWGKTLAIKGFILRSGHADGADLAFEKGCDSVNGKKEIYLPWKSFNGSDSELYNLSKEAYDIAAYIYGTGWKYLKPPVKKLMARNMFQIMGYDLKTPSKFVLCWTPDGCTSKQNRSKKTGGTGQAIAYADEMKIPIFNFKNPNDEIKFIDFLSGL